MLRERFAVSLHFDVMAMPLGAAGLSTVKRWIRKTLPPANRGSASAVGRNRWAPRSEVVSLKTASISHSPSKASRRVSAGGLTVGMSPGLSLMLG